MTYLCLSTMLICMRTTLEIDDTLFHLAKEFAVKKRKPLRTVVEEALREKLARYPSQGEFEKATLVVSEKTGGIRSGVDLDNSASLLDAMESLDGPAGR